MRSSTHWAPGPTRLLFVAVPLLALMLLTPSHAFACGETASEVTYCTPLGMESGEAIKQHETPAKPHPTPNTQATPGEERTEATATEPEAEPHPSEGHRSQAPPPTNGGNHPSGGDPSNHVSQGRAVSSPQGSGKSITPEAEGPTTKAVPASASSGGSSPVLPILVAIVVLAGISIGFVVYRERRGGDGQAGYTGAGG